MAMARRWKMVLLLAALAAVVMVAAAASLEAEHKFQECESEHSMSKVKVKAPERRREREWWEEEEEEEEEGERERERERRTRREEEEEEEEERERERERRREREEEEREREEEEERAEERAREREEERERQRRREEEREEEEERERKEREREEEEEEEHGRHRNETLPSPLVLPKPKAFLKTAAGSVRVLPAREEELAVLRQLGLGFVTLEPKALLLPHYLDAPVVLYVLRGNASLGWVASSRYASVKLTEGDVYTFPGGTVHYILNTDSKLRLEIFSALDARNSLSPGHFQPFFVAGGRDPPTVLSGFSPDVLSAAYNVSREPIAEILGSQRGGAIIFTTPGTDVNKSTADVRPMLPNKPAGNRWNALQDRLNAPWSRSSPEKPYNLLNKNPDVKNDNGWSSTLTEETFAGLKHADLSLFAVNLKAGSMVAPHWNPRATEVALVTKGRGYVHVAFPNGTTALDTEVTEGTVFVVPRYYPVSQVASRDGTFQFVGFSTCSKPNNPQFLAGENSVLNLLAKEAEFDVLAASFDVSKDTVRDFLAPQKDVVILPGFVVDWHEERTGRAAY